MRRALLIHGWRVKDPRRSVGKLAQPLDDLGYNTVALNYGFTMLPSHTRFTSNKVAKNWAARTVPSDIVIGHSNGARIAWEMSHTGQCLASTMVWINPALDTDCVPGRSVQRLLVVYNHGDMAVRAGSMIPNSIWGDMGYLGYQPDSDPFGQDPRVTNVAYGRGHSPWDNPRALADLIDRWVKQAPVLLEG